MHYNSTIKFNWKAVLDNSENVWHQMNDDYYIIKFGVSLPLNASISQKTEIMIKHLSRYFPYLNDISYLNIPENDFGEVKEEPFDSNSRSNSSVILHYSRAAVEKIVDEKPHLFV